jgi:hypothetical protein
LLFSPFCFLLIGDLISLFTLFSSLLFSIAFPFENKDFFLDDFSLLLSAFVSF